MARSKTPKDEPIGVKLQWPEDEASRPLPPARLRPTGAVGGDAPTGRRRTRPGRSAMLALDPAPAPVAAPLDQLVPRVEALAAAVDSLQKKLSTQEARIASVAEGVASQLDGLSEATEQLREFRTAIEAQLRAPAKSAELHRQIEELVAQVKAVRRSLSVRRRDAEGTDRDAVDRIVHAVVERLAQEGGNARPSGRGRRSSVAD